MVLAPCIPLSLATSPGACPENRWPFCVWENGVLSAGQSMSLPTPSSLSWRVPCDKTRWPLVYKKMVYSQRTPISITGMLGCPEISRADAVDDLTELGECRTLDEHQSVHVCRTANTSYMAILQLEWCWQTGDQHRQRVQSL